MLYVCMNVRMYVCMYVCTQRERESGRDIISDKTKYMHSEDSDKLCIYCIIIIIIIIILIFMGLSEREPTYCIFE